MPLDNQIASLETLKNDLEMVHAYFVNTKELGKPITECNLDDMLKPPAYRESVEVLRKGQKMGHFTRQMIYKRTEKVWKSVPKSYPIPPARD